MPEFIPVLYKDAIARRIDVAAKQVSGGCKDGYLILIGVFKSAFVFMAELIRQFLLNAITIDYMRRISSAVGAEKSDHIHLLKGLIPDGKRGGVLGPGPVLACLYSILQGCRPNIIKAYALVEKCKRKQIDTPRLRRIRMPGFFELQK